VLVGASAFPRGAIALGTITRAASRWPTEALKEIIGYFPHPNHTFPSSPIIILLGESNMHC